MDFSEERKNTFICALTPILGKGQTAQVSLTFNILHSNIVVECQGGLLFVECYSRRLLIRLFLFFTLSNVIQNT